jgi:hypothetical protein
MSLPVSGAADARQRSARPATLLQTWYNSTWRLRGLDRRQRPADGAVFQRFPHGADIVEWYGTGTWSTALVMHNLPLVDLSNALDPSRRTEADSPVNTWTRGHWFRTQMSSRIPCRNSHMSGNMDTQDPAALLVAFDQRMPRACGRTTGGPQTGSCSNLFLPRTQSPDWYSLAGVTLGSCALPRLVPLASAGRSHGSRRRLRRKRVLVPIM